MAHHAINALASSAIQQRMPVWYLAHGGGPMPLLGDTTHMGIINHWKSLAATLPSKPRALLVISAHWEEDKPTVTTSPAPPMLYDYSGFPDEAYKITYDAPGDPTLAKKAIKLLSGAGFKTAEDSQRGFDHGTFVPLKLIFPQADIPVVTVSLLKDLDPMRHIQLGEAIAPLREEGVLVVGSGLSFHNMQAFRSSMGGQSSDEAAQKSKEFDNWLQDTLATGEYSPEGRKQLMANWANAPSGRFSHPREEHFLPAHVALGCAGSQKAAVMFSDSLFGAAISAYRWD